MPREHDNRKQPGRPLSGPRDALRIDVGSADDLRYWAGKLHCTPSQLREAVGQVGAVPSNVEAYLRQRSHGLENIDLPPGRRPS